MNTARVFLGALMIRPEFALESLSALNIDDFPADLQSVFAALSGFCELRGTLDTVQVCAKYPDLKDIVLACASECEAECVRITRENVENWVQLIKEQAALARVQGIAVQIASSLTVFSDLPDLYSKMGEALTLDRGESDFQPIGQLVDDYVCHLDEQPRYIRTGLSVLDRNLSLSLGNFFVVGGRPSAGKTAFALQLACNMAKSGYRTCFFSLETDAATLTTRVIANRLGASLADVKRKTVPVDELDFLAELHKWPLFIKSAAGKGTAWIKAQAQRMRADIVFVDYLQLLADGRAKDRYQAVTSISMGLHELAQTTGILVVALAQLNRNAAHAAPSTADLKESGQLEQDADAVLLLSNDDSQYLAILAKTRRAVPAKFQSLLTRSASAFWKSQGVYHENINRARRREPYHYTAEGETYIAGILSILQHGQSIPVRVLQLIYHMLLPYGPSGDTKR